MFYCDFDDLDDWTDALSNGPWPNMGRSSNINNSTYQNSSPCFYETKKSLQKKHQELVKQRNLLSVYKAHKIIELNAQIQEIEDQLTGFEVIND